VGLVDAAALVNSMLERFLVSKRAIQSLESMMFSLCNLTTVASCGTQRLCNQRAQFETERGSWLSVAASWLITKHLKERVLKVSKPACALMLVMCFSIVGCMTSSTSQHAVQRPQPTADSRPLIQSYVPSQDERDIIGLLLQTLGQKGSKKLVIINDQTTITSFLYFDIDEELARIDTRIAKNMPDVDKAAYEDFKSKNRSKFEYKPDADLFDAPYVWYSSLGEQVTKRRKAGENFWNIIAELQPDAMGYLKLSAIGFNHETDKAFMYLEINKGSMNARGDYLFLKKTDGQWEVASSALAWIS
jgi:hypothetical protein